MKKFLLTLPALVLLTGFQASADEGMWMVNAISRALVQNMQREGLRLPGKAIYDEQSVSLKDAIVSLDFGCTGSMISPEGLLITNHHCAYSDVHALSTPEHNYLEEGFWARSRRPPESPSGCANSVTSWKSATAKARAPKRR